MVMLRIDVSAYVEYSEGTAAVVCSGITAVESNVRYGSVAAERESRSSGSPEKRPPREGPSGY